MKVLDNLSLYFHIPFCQTKCPYCDFNSYETSINEVRLREMAYIKALIKELEFQRERYYLSDRIIKSIFIGGGTPSLLSGSGISLLLNSIRELFSFSNEIEITIEANPRSVKEDYPDEKLFSFFEAGINRISFGVQSLQKKKLEFLGRWHLPEDSISSIEIAKKAGFKNFNIDLMFGIKDESISDWLNELKEVIKLSPAHISSYMLTIEPGTDFGKKSRKGQVFTTDEDSFVEFYSLTQEILKENSYSQYEISNYSRNGMECVHNLVYWEGGDYLGLGAGAHSFIKKNFKNEESFSSEDSFALRWSNTPSPELYVSRIMKDSCAEQIIDPIDYEKSRIEAISLGLRMTKGIDKDAPFLNDDVLEKIKILSKSGLIEIDDTRIKIPNEKFHLADGIINEII